MVDTNHQFTSTLVREYGVIFVGNISIASQINSGQGKSALDASWGLLRTFLKYKCASAAGLYGEINEAYSTQTCSVCNSRTGPKGREGLGIREWVCAVCSKRHHRDVNAARNILAVGRDRLAVGIPFL